MKYVARRLAFFVVTCWMCITINFILPRMMPGNAATAMMARYKGRISGSAIKALSIAFGIDDKQGALTQYLHYLGNLLTGHFGISLTFFPESVGSVVASALPWTVGLVGVTTVLAFAIGTVVGMMGAWWRGGKLDSILPPVFIITSAFPYFWIAMLAILVFGIKLHWLPLAFGYATDATPNLSLSFILDVLQHAILPSVTILITSVGGWILTMRNNMISTLTEDYVAMARMKGLSSRRIMLDYAGRNAILPNLTGFAMSLGFVVSGAVLVEYVFNYPGVGYMLLDAVGNSDYALMQTLFLLITVGVLVAVLAIDFVTLAIDPRTRAEP